MIRFWSRFGTVRPAVGGSTTSTSVATADDAGMLLGGSSELSGWVAAVSASPLSVSSFLPSPRTTSEVSVTSAVKLLVITRS